MSAPQWVRALVTDEHIALAVDHAIRFPRDPSPLEEVIGNLVWDEVGSGATDDEIAAFIDEVETLAAPAVRAVWDAMR